MVCRRDRGCPRPSRRTGRNVVMGGLGGGGGFGLRKRKHARRRDMPLGRLQVRCGRNGRRSRGRAAVSDPIVPQIRTRLIATAPPDRRKSRRNIPLFPLIARRRERRSELRSRRARDAWVATCPSGRCGGVLRLVRLELVSTTVVRPSVALSRRDVGCLDGWQIERGGAGAVS